MLPQVQAFQNAQLKDPKDVPNFRPGDTLRLHLRIKEGDKSRLQVFDWVCIGRSGAGSKETITARRTSYGVSMERVVPVHSPMLEKIEVVRRGQVRRAKLYYLRDRTGKRARIQEITLDQKRKIQAVEDGDAAAAKIEADALAKAEAEAKAAETAAAAEAAAAEEEAKKAAEAAEAEAAKAEQTPAEEAPAEEEGEKKE